MEPDHLENSSREGERQACTKGTSATGGVGSALSCRWVTMVNSMREVVRKRAQILLLATSRVKPGLVSKANAKAATAYGSGLHPAIIPAAQRRVKNWQAAQTVSTLSPHSPCLLSLHPPLLTFLSRS